MAHELNYSGIDRLLHRVAFAAPFVQLTAADVEKVLYGGAYASVRAGRPVFITSLPRAGTTLLLEALNHVPSLASQSYRDMPFVMAPLLWSRLSRPFQQPEELKERAHGDGMDVGFDSPEAFEEVLWRTFWPGKYKPTRIDLWSESDDESEAREFFVDHMRKIVALRRPDRPTDGRYLSKNNANIARLDLIARMFPDASVVVPVRRPIDHARSLLRQHRRFLAMHRATPFVRQYMADIGHYEFGDLHRPIGFDGLDEWTANREPTTLDYWLGYWIAAFERPLRDRRSVHVVSYEAMCADPMGALTSLCGRLGLDDEGTLATMAALFHEPPSPAAADSDADPTLRRHAERLYCALVE